MTKAPSGRVTILRSTYNNMLKTLVERDNLARAYGRQLTISTLLSIIIVVLLFIG